MSSLPGYTLLITEGQYPFKNAHITKIFEIMVEQQLPLNRLTHTMLQAYHSVKNPLLVNILKIKKIEQSSLKIQYEYVETPLHHYIRRYIHDSLQLRMEKLLMAIRDIAYIFATKQINTLKAISIKNIGVKMSEAYRQSMFVGKMKNPQPSQKQICMPDFKIFIDPESCQFIEKYQDIGRLVIETDKIICQTLRAEIDQLISQIQAEENSIDKKQVNSNTSLKPFSSSMNSSTFRENLQRESLDFDKLKREETEASADNFCFSPKRKKKKRKLQGGEKVLPDVTNSMSPMSFKKGKINHQADKKNNQKQTEKQECQSMSNFKTKSEVFSPIICYKASQAIEKSRRNLQKFKKKFLYKVSE